MLTSTESFLVRLEQSRKRRQMFQSLGCSGDWHTPLYSRLRESLDDVRSPRTREIIEQLICLMDATDECVHTVTQSVEPPAGLEPSFVLQFLERGTLHETGEWVVDGRVVHVTAPIRGDIEYAKSHLDQEISSAIWNAQFAVSRDELTRTLPNPR